SVFYVGQYSMQIIAQGGSGFRANQHRGTKTKTRQLAIKAGHKSFEWFCRRGHGKTKFGVAGTGQCRLCIEEHRKAYRQRMKTANQQRSTTTEDHE
ncbi:hypothetical protein, partial [Caballeronia telluris]|uniref:hypothetical protein n=1 Tax=Caballeronia telluris TaxID=326475 RepID=UPI001F21A020